MKTILVDAVNTFVVKEEGVNIEMHKLLEQYPNDKIVLTNANDEEFLKYGLDAVSYKLFSLKHNPDKIDPKFYETMLSEFDLTIDDVVYFEHHIGAVESARSIGINTYHYDMNTRDLDALKSFLDENL